MVETSTDINDVAYAQERLRLCLSSIKMGVWDWDVVNDVLTWDPSLYELYDVREEDFRGAFEAWESTVHPDDKERSKHELHQALYGDIPFDTSFRVITGNGDIRVIAAKGRVEKDAEGKPLRIMGVNWDITKERRQAETILEQQATLVQSAKMASLGEMAGGVAHEINNPLAIITAKVSRIQIMAQRGDIDKTQLLNDLEQINATCLRISKVISGLRSISRNAQNDPFEVISVRQVIADTLGLCEQRFINNLVKLETHMDVEALVAGRAAQLEQVLLNLLGNALDAVVTTEKPWVRIDVEATEKHVRIRITDSGPGIPKTIVGKIMEPFFTTKPVGKGTGLGLSISRGIIEDHKGILKLDEKSPNTSFIIELPLY